MARANVAVVGAAGQTGRPIVRALSGRGARVRAVVRPPSPGGPVPEATDVVAADLGDAAALTTALEGASVAYYIPPAFEVREVTFGSNVVEAARAAGLARLVYHSVLHAPTLP